MDRKHNKSIVPYAKDLRKNMTAEERHLWYDFLRGYPVKFCRQKIIGKFIVDFYAAKAKLVVEIDGSQHFDAKKAAYDRERTNYLEQFGLRVIRIPNNEINRNFRGVCDYIDQCVKERIKRQIKERKMK